MSHGASRPRAIVVTRASPGARAGAAAAVDDSASAAAAYRENRGGDWVRGGMGPRVGAGGSGAR